VEKTVDIDFHMFLENVGISHLPIVGTSDYRKKLLIIYDKRRPTWPSQLLFYG
jgi:hypothetical protein